MALGNLAPTLLMTRPIPLTQVADPSSLPTQVVHVPERTAIVRRELGVLPEVVAIQAAQLRRIRLAVMGLGALAVALTVLAIVGVWRANETTAPTTTVQAHAPGVSSPIVPTRPVAPLSNATAVKPSRRTVRTAARTDPLDKRW